MHGPGPRALVDTLPVADAAGPLQACFKGSWPCVGVAFRAARCYGLQHDHQTGPDLAHSPDEVAPVAGCPAGRLLCLVERVHVILPVADQLERA